MNPSLRDAVSAHAFEARYRVDPDPWDYARSEYEQGKYSKTIGALSRARYAHAFEPACSVGELTARLAQHCDHLLATDVSPTAVELARDRCAEFQNVRIECEDLLTPLRENDSFDLLVLSEVGYYFEREELSKIAVRLGNSLVRSGELVAVHWLGHSPDHVLHGDEVHSVLLQTLPLKHTRTERHPGFRLDAWVCT
jgi:SAM-dependent methyltransferase